MLSYLGDGALYESLTLRREGECVNRSDRQPTNMRPGASYFMTKISLLLLIAAMTSAAESNGVLVGLITTRSGEALRNRQIILVDETEGVRRKTITDELGIFAFDLLPPGAYRLEADAGELTSSCGRRIVLRSGEKRSWRLVWAEAISRTERSNRVSPEGLSAR